MLPKSDVVMAIVRSGGQGRACLKVAALGLAREHRQPHPASPPNINPDPVADMPPNQPQTYPLGVIRQI